jgi:hypothetical protein
MSNTNSDSDENQDVPLNKKRKWRVRNDDKYQRNAIKNARLNGSRYTNNKGNEVQEKIFSGDTGW